MTNILYCVNFENLFFNFLLQCSSVRKNMSRWIVDLFAKIRSQKIVTSSKVRASRWPINSTTSSYPPSLQGLVQDSSGCFTKMRRNAVIFIYSRAVSCELWKNLFLEYIDIAVAVHRVLRNVESHQSTIPYAGPYSQSDGFPRVPQSKVRIFGGPLMNVMTVYSAK